LGVAFRWGNWCHCIMSRLPAIAEDYPPSGLNLDRECLVGNARRKLSTIEGHLARLGNPATFKTHMLLQGGWSVLQRLRHPRLKHFLAAQMYSAEILSARYGAGLGFGRQPDQGISRRLRPETIVKQDPRQATPLHWFSGSCASGPVGFRCHLNGLISSSVHEVVARGPPCRAGKAVARYARLDGLAGTISGANSVGTRPLAKPPCLGSAAGHESQLALRFLRFQKQSATWHFVVPVPQLAVSRAGNAPRR